MSTPQKLLTLRQVMEFAAVSDSTVRRWIRRGELRAYRVGRQLRIDAADLTQFLVKSL